MAAPTRAVQKLQKILADVGPSTHGLLRAVAIDALKLRLLDTLTGARGR